MLIKQLNKNTIMGFSRFQNKAEVPIEDIIEKSLEWSESFLEKIDGINFHCLLRNTKGELADVIFAKDPQTFSMMNDAFGQSSHSKQFLSLLMPETIRLNQVHILDEFFEIPSSFGAIEIGFMQTDSSKKITISDIKKASAALEDDYLFKQESSQAHFIGQANENTFADVTFGKSVGSVRKTCFGFYENPTAVNFLNLFEESSFELDFWYPLA